MKKVFILIPLLSIAVFCATLKFNTAYSHEGGGDSGNAGVPAINAGATCGSGSGTNVGCHDNGNAVATLVGLVSSNIPVSGYVPGTTYTITVTATAPIGFAASVIGFSVTPRNTTGVFKGTLVITNTTTTKLNGLSQYATHKMAGIPATGNAKTYTFNWIAPTSGTGNITFYGVALFGNGDSDPGLDVAVKGTLVANEDLTAGISSISQNISSLSMYHNNDLNRITINLSLLNSAKMYISVSDINGKMVSRTESYNLVSGRNELILNATSISKGVYSVNIAMENQLPISRKILVD
jgi:Secretion system C-terminal sorting domain